MGPESMFPCRGNSDIEGSFSPIHFGKVPENLLPPTSSAYKHEQFCKVEKRSPEKLLYLSCSQLRYTVSTMRLGCYLIDCFAIDLWPLNFAYSSNAWGCFLIKDCSINQQATNLSAPWSMRRYYQLESFLQDLG